MLENISNRLLETSNSTESEATIYTIKCLVENAICILKDASDAEILVHFSLLNSVMVCTLKHLFLNSCHLDLHSSPKFHQCCNQLDELRQHYFKELLGNDSVSYTWSRLTPIVRNSLTTLRQTKRSDHISMQTLIGAALFDPLRFPVEDLLSILYGHKNSSLVVANLFMHTPIFAGLSFVKPTLHVWRADAISKRLNKYGLFASMLHWICRPLYIILFIVGRNCDDSLLPLLPDTHNNASTSYLAYLYFTCNWDMQPLPVSLSTAYFTSTALDKAVHMLSEYPIFEDPDEYILASELISSCGIQAYALLFGLNQAGPIQHPTIDHNDIKKLIVRLQSALAENCCNIKESIYVQTLIEHLIYASTKSIDQLKYPMITLICFSIVTCYFSLSPSAAVDTFSLSRASNPTIVKAIFQFETLILVSLHKCVLDALCNFKEQGRWLELYPTVSNSPQYIHSCEDAKISIYKILELPLSAPIAELFRSMSNPSSKQTKLKTIKGRSRVPFLCTRVSKFVVVLQGVERELSLFELLVWDLRHLELSQLVSYIQQLWGYSWIEAETQLRVAMETLYRQFYTNNSVNQLKLDGGMPDNSNSVLHTAHTSRTANQDQVELIARSKLVQAMKHIGSIQLTDILQAEKYVNDINHNATIVHLESDTINRLVAWGVENGYFGISGHNPQTLYYIN